MELDILSIVGDHEGLKQRFPTPFLILAAAPVLRQLPATSCEMVLTIAQLAFAVTCSFT